MVFPKLVRLLGGQCHQKETKKYHFHWCDCLVDSAIKKKQKITISIVVCNKKTAALRDRTKLHVIQAVACVA